MTKNPITLTSTATCHEAAARMSQWDIGDILVTREGKLMGILTDRDIVVRAVAEGRDPSALSVGEICSQDVLAVAADEDLERAIIHMRKNQVRRLVVVDGSSVVGVLSLGDLAVASAPESTLGTISQAPGNN